MQFVFFLMILFEAEVKLNEPFVNEWSSCLGGRKQWMTFADFSRTVNNIHLGNVIKNAKPGMLFFPINILFFYL
jgi:hypothetical protein